MQAQETKQASVLDSKKEKNKEIASPGKKKNCMIKEMLLWYTTWTTWLSVNELYIFMFNINLIENYDYNILGNCMNNSGESDTCILF